MKYKLMSLGLGIALSLGILLFMATLVEPPKGEKASAEQKSIVINMQNEVTEVQARERPVPQEPEPLPEPPAALASTPLPMPAAAPLPPARARARTRPRPVRCQSPAAGNSRGC